MLPARAPAVKLGAPPSSKDAVTESAEPATIRLLCVEDNPDDVELMGLAL